jgi:hypothetical protein
LGEILECYYTGKKPERWEATIYSEVEMIQTYEPRINVKILYSDTKFYSTKCFAKLGNTELKQRNESLGIISSLSFLSFKPFDLAVFVSRSLPFLYFFLPFFYFKEESFVTFSP